MDQSHSTHPAGTTVIMDLFVKDARHIYLACGATDFHKPLLIVK
ncbi:hypothetical protein [Clostridium sp. C105KSO13]|nr:hypothetical protein [Clostridium sp. C105KSO13]CUX40316.1 hypothetical protein BN3456_02060 [Clostridium sp. C105KSO13]